MFRGIYIFKNPAASSYIPSSKTRFAFLFPPWIIFSDMEINQGVGKSHGPLSF